MSRPRRVQRKILPHRLRLDVADAAPVEISGRCMVDRVAAPPEVVGRQGQDADRPTDPVVGGLARQERSVPAIVLDHEQADEQPGGERRQREREPVKAMMRGEQHRGPERGERREGDQELEQWRGPCPRFGRGRAPAPTRAPTAPGLSVPSTSCLENSARRAVVRQATSNGRSTTRFGRIFGMILAASRFKGSYSGSARRSDDNSRRARKKQPPRRLPPTSCTDLFRGFSPVRARS